MINGRIVTFYSYKGGVGRTMAMANIAVLLAKQKKVLIIDWDLEAPGLEKYFSGFLPSSFESKFGLINVLKNESANVELDWRSAITQLKGSDWSLDAIFSGSADQNYASNVTNFSWETFFSDEEGGDCLLYTSPSPRDGLLSRMPSSA